MEQLGWQPDAVHSLPTISTTSKSRHEDFRSSKPVNQRGCRVEILCIATREFFIIKLRGIGDLDNIFGDIIGVLQRIADLAGNEWHVSERTLVYSKPAVVNHAVGRVAVYSTGSLVNQSPFCIPTGASPASPRLERLMPIIGRATRACSAVLAPAHIQRPTKFHHPS